MMQTQRDADTGYMSYMLRMWHKKDSNGKAVWCASLQEPGSHKIETFEDTNTMFAYLQMKMSTGMGIEHEEPDAHTHTQPQQG